ncbi:hypothetical protein ACHAXT_011054 [Thalassiosira profunda]
MQRNEESETEPQGWAAARPSAEVAVDVTAAPVPPLPVMDDGSPPKKKRKSPGKPTVPRTLGNDTHRLVATQSLLEASSRVDGAVAELRKYCDILSDPGGDDEGRKEAIKNIRGSILPLLHVTSVTLRDTGAGLAPFGGLRALHDRNEATRKRAVLDKTSDKSSALQMIDNYLQRSTVEIPSHITEPSPRPEAVVEKDTVPVEAGEETKTIRLVRPQNGTVYTRSEALRVVKMYRKGSNERGAAVRAMIAKGWAPTSAKTIYRMCQADEEGLPILDEGWRGNGRPSAAKMEEAQHRFVSARPLGEPSTEDYVDVTIATKKKGRKRKVAAADDLLQPNTSEGNSVGEVESVKQPASKPPAKKKAPKKKEEEFYDDSVRNFPLPAPEDGKAYKKSKAVRIAKQYQKGPPERRWALKAMLFRGYVPNSMKTLYRLIERDEKGLEIVDNPWGRPGCPALLTNDDVDAIVDRIRAGNVKLSGIEDVERAIVEFVREKRTRQGQDPHEPVVFTVSTLRNYATLFRSKLPSVYWKE